MCTHFIWVFVRLADGWCDMAVVLRSCSHSYPFRMHAICLTRHFNGITWKEKTEHNHFVNDLVCKRKICGKCNVNCSFSQENRIRYFRLGFSFLSSVLCQKAMRECVFIAKRWEKVATESQWNVARWGITIGDCYRRKLKRWLSPISRYYCIWSGTRAQFSLTHKNCVCFFLSYYTNTYACRTHQLAYLLLLLYFALFSVFPCIPRQIHKTIFTLTSIFILSQ